MVILYIFICLTLTVAMCAAVFVYGRQIGYTQRDAEHHAEKLRVQEDYVKELQQHVFELEHQIESEQKERTRTQQPKRDGWDTFNVRESR